MSLRSDILLFWDSKHVSWCCFLGRIMYWYRFSANCLISWYRRFGVSYTDSGIGLSWTFMKTSNSLKSSEESNVRGSKPPENKRSFMFKICFFSLGSSPSALANEFSSAPLAKARFWRFFSFLLIRGLFSDLSPGSANSSSESYSLMMLKSAMFLMVNGSFLIWPSSSLFKNSLGAKRQFKIWLTTVEMSSSDSHWRTYLFKICFMHRITTSLSKMYFNYVRFLSFISSAMKPIYLMLTPFWWK